MFRSFINEHSTRAIALTCLVLAASCQAEPPRPKQSNSEKEKPMGKLATATFGGGCFWCTEAVFLELQGVEKVTSGYSGGRVPNPTYEQVCSGTTGHAEVIQIEYDPEKIDFSQLLEVHFKTHDPTTLNRQGADVGTQYRSVVFYHDQQQKETAEQVIKQFNEQGVYDDPVVTEVAEFEKFYPAEQYHQDFFANNPNQGYCRAVVQPKVEKFRKVFADKLKESATADK